MDWRRNLDTAPLVARSAPMVLAATKIGAVDGASSGSGWMWALGIAGALVLGAVVLTKTEKPALTTYITIRYKNKFQSIKVEPSEALTVAAEYAKRPAVQGVIINDYRGSEWRWLKPGSQAEKDQEATDRRAAEVMAKGA